MQILITGAAGFIGFHLSKKLLNKKISVIGFDNFNSYYDPTLKKARYEELKRISIANKIPFNLIKGELSNWYDLEEIFKSYSFSKVFHLGAQAGVRYSIQNPSEYIKSNIVGFNNILELSKQFKINHFLYASSSSVYGGNLKTPFSEKDSVDHPVSVYAATKKSNELMAHTYSHLFNLPSTGLRFFTVYGPWGRPDMALFKFTKSIINNQPIQIFNNGLMKRDFTYIDDVVESLIKLMDKTPLSDPKFDRNNPNPSTSWCPYKVFNIGNSNPVPLMEYVLALEKSLGKKAIKEFVAMQQGDVESTHADTTLLNDCIDFKPNTSIQDGIDSFVKWYKEFYKIKDS